MQLTACIGQFTASGGIPKIPTYIQELLIEFQHSSLDNADLTTIHASIQKIENDKQTRVPPITTAALEASARKGDHIHGIFKKILPPVSHPHFHLFFIHIIPIISDKRGLC
jgi:hypothetical protein